MSKNKLKISNLITHNQNMQKILNICRNISTSNSYILITGASGTGKEVLAKAIHNSSNRVGDFIAVNCSAIPDTLFESEFFGYSSGAFTGALLKGKDGYFQMSNNGTLFLDEIGDLPINQQGKLLRALEDKKIRPIGSNKSFDLNLRVICATNKNLDELIKLDKFREDLYYRINIISLNLPKLKERKEDIPMFIDIFLNELSYKNNKLKPLIDNDVYDILSKHSWNGNIRELKNTIEYMLITSKTNKLTKKLIPEYILNATKKTDSLSNYDIPKIFNNKFSLDDYLYNKEKELIKIVLNKSNGNIAEASRILKIPRTTMYYKLKKFNLNN